MRRFPAFDELIASAALALMTLIPLVEIALRPLHGKGIDNAPLLVQHLGLVLAMFGGVLAERGGHLTALGNGLANARQPALRAASAVFAKGSAAILCGMLAAASWRFVASELDAGRELAYGLPVWWVQALMPAGFLILGARLGSRCSAHLIARVLLGLALTGAGFLFAYHFDGSTLPVLPFAVGLLAALLAGAPIFAVLGGLALALFWSEGQPLASVPLSHYQITVNPSLPALPLFTLAGLVFARSGAARRLGTLFTACFGGGSTGTAIAAALLCSFFTAFTGGSGVTILALGGLLLPLLKDAGFPERKGISLVTSASALGVLLAPSVPLIMYAIIARVPINTMFLAGLVPALVMVVFLLIVGGYLRRGDVTAPQVERPKADLRVALGAAWAARWEILAPVVAIGSLVSGLATPTESAALTAAYAILTQAIAHRELDFAVLRRCLADCAQVIGGVMLILGMALGLTNYLVDAGIPDAAVEWVQATLPNKFAFLVALNVFLFLAGALMEIYAAIVVLVPLLLPVALSYGIDPVHFGVIFLAVMEMGFLCPPAGMNIFFASAMFAKPIREVAVSVLPALLAIFLGALAISWIPELATGLPTLLGR
ncbi:MULTISPECIES: TRAP transporter large permease subunit [Zoogloea]|jgi:tripartite ATP-independent transporter DctM subunit|uniref:TRAP transporter large permease subunit n=1 Tax=Zoogloea oleivorans TaxID=1552750 RepID=A0A6C2CC79_9RHOO|nr:MULTISPECIES: TRAP transporter large permease subunit [Zoogloea]MBP8133563.1 TRAP transporter large permease subunit [Zoogloea sp.]MBT9498997.1 TRAP transporter large permease subunit [Zoogloea sp.]MDD2670293.1 TRAP transporter large permease subunit [Zoogloea sp.]TYC51564.1 TRAP transporter large permease subunit [Zoogloea oleivorans]